mgnify:CR=1 FL=1
MLRLTSGLSSKASSLLRINNSHPYYRRLVLALFFTALAGFVLAVALFLTVLFNGELLTKRFCLSNSCFEFFFKEISAVLVFCQIVIGFVALGGAVGVLFVALLNYLATDKTSKFTNYISHLTLFQAYFVNEVEKLAFLSVSSFDVQRLYGFIFEGAELGIMNPSSRYMEFLAKLSCEIETSNKMASNAMGGSFRHLEHQGRLREVFSTIGFSLPIQPKGDYFEVETDLLSLITSINVSFCRLPSTVLAVRSYQ